MLRRSRGCHDLKAWLAKPRYGNTVHKMLPVRDIVQRSETLEVGIQHKTLLTAGSVERPLIPILVRASE